MLFFVIVAPNSLFLSFGQMITNVRKSQIFVSNTCEQFVGQKYFLNHSAVAITDGFHMKILLNSKLFPSILTLLLVFCQLNLANQVKSDRLQLELRYPVGPT